MWIYTEHGFFNVMKDGEAEGQMKVRARRREHIEKFIELIGDPEVEVIESHGDYPFRFFAPQEAVVGVVVRMLEESTYTKDFKGHCAQALGDDVGHVYRQVWTETALGLSRSFLIPLIGPLLLRFTRYPVPQMMCKIS